jgi:hypothetical protein
MSRPYRTTQERFQRFRSPFMRLFGVRPVGRAYPGYTLSLEGFTLTVDGHAIILND